MTDLLAGRYLSDDGMGLMIGAAFALGLIIGALVMDFWWDPTGKKRRPARVRPPEPVKRVARHRATSGVPMKGGQALMANAPRPMTQDEIPAVPPQRGQGGVSGGGHPQDYRHTIDVRA